MRVLELHVPHMCQGAAADSARHRRRGASGSTARLLDRTCLPPVRTRCPAVVPWWSQLR